MSIQNNIRFIAFHVSTTKLVTLYNLRQEPELRHVTMKGCHYGEGPLLRTTTVPQTHLSNLICGPLLKMQDKKMVPSTTLTLLSTFTRTILGIKSIPANYLGKNSPLLCKTVPHWVSYFSLQLQPCHLKGQSISILLIVIIFTFFHGFFCALSFQEVGDHGPPQFSVIISYY